MVINTNVQALQTANNLNKSSNALAKSLSRLSSGSKIIAPSDDAAGLAVSSRLESQLKRLDAAINNVVNAVSFTQTQDGFLKTIDKAFRRMSELAMFAQDSTKSASDLTLYSQEFTQLQDYVSQSVKQTFNSVKLFSDTPLAVTIDSSGTTFDMAPIDLGKSEYTSSLNIAATVNPLDITRDSAGVISVKLNKDQISKVAAGGSLTLAGLTNATLNGTFDINSVNTTTNTVLLQSSTKDAALTSMVDTAITASTVTPSSGGSVNSIEDISRASDGTIKLKVPEFIGGGAAVANPLRSYKVGDSISLAGFPSGNSMEAANGVWKIASIAPNGEISLDSKGSGSTAAWVAGSPTSITVNASFASEFGAAKTGLDITSVPRAQASLTRIRNSIDKLAQDRASLGAVQSRLNFTNEQLTVTKENLSAAISRIADVDVAEEATSYARYQILVQSGTSMLAQANKMPQSALQLLQG
ncbi:MAG: flagellin [Verrucomicrobia bacterium]|nr:flagellin [Verrucomicrobiota bacterium]